MVGVGEHVDRLHFLHAVETVHEGEVARLCRRVAADVDDAFRAGVENHVDHVFVHSCAWRVDDHHVGTSVLGDESVGEHVLHVAGKEDGVVDAVDLRVEFRVGNRLGHVFDANHFFHLPRHEVGYCAGSGIEVVDQVVGLEVCHAARHLVELVCLQGVSLIE